MPKIADQVTAIEHDLNAALATIDQLTAANSALVSANTSLQRDNVALQLEVNNMKHYVDDTRTMADELAASALEMLRASRRHVGPAPTGELKKTALVATKDDPSAQMSEAEVIAMRQMLDDMRTAPLTGLRENDTIAYGEASLDAKVAALPEKWPAQQAVAEIMASDATLLDRDSGDEQQTQHATVPANKFEPLPIFLQRDTAFETPANVRPIFG
jgi:hypothetical protein